MNEILFSMVVAGAAGGLMAAFEPRMARRLATMLYARAAAVEAGREAYGVVMRSGIDVRPVVFSEGKTLRENLRRMATSPCGEER